MSGNVQCIAVLISFAGLRDDMALPEYLDHQGTGAVTLTVSLDTIPWRLIATDQSPGILDAIGEIKLPEPEVVVSLLFGRTLVIADANNGNIPGWVHVAVQRIGVHTDLLGKVSRCNGRDAFPAGLGRTCYCGQ